MKFSAFKNFLIIILISTTGYLHALDFINLTPEEKYFLKDNPKITLGSDIGWEPFVIANENSIITGYDAEVLALINQVSGANFQLTLGNWNAVKESQQRHQIDGLSTAVFSESFAEHSLFSNSYLSLEKIIFTRKDLTYSVENIPDLEGRKFGIYRDNGVARELANTIQNVEIIEFDSTQELIRGVTTGKADFMLGNGAMFHLLNKSGNPFLTPAIFLHESPLELVFVIRNDFPEAISIINKSLQLIGTEKLSQLKNKWFSSGPPIEGEIHVQLSAEELAYLQQKKQLNLCIDPDWMPLEKIENGLHRGMSADYFKFFSKNINVPITLIETKTWDETIQLTKNKTCDIISLAMPTKERKTYLNFTKPLIKTPIVLATKPNITFVDDLALIKNKKIGIVRNYAINRIIRNRYPNINVVDVLNAQHGLQKVADAELFGYIDTLATVGYLFQTEFIGELKISGKYDKDWKMSVATRKDEPLLLNIFNKLIEAIPEQTHQKIFNQYIAINYKESYNYKLFWEIMSIISCILLFLLYRYAALKKYNLQIKRYLLVIDNHILTASFDKKGYITDVSSALCKLSGYKKEELIGQHYEIFHHPKTEKQLYRSLKTMIKKGEVWQGEILSLNKNGSSYWADVKITPAYYPTGALRAYTVILQDISDKKRVEKIAVTDTLTQIPNRLFINNSFDHEFERCQRYKSHFSIILIDIDHFKEINDIHGHKVGDDVLINLATILKQNIRQLDLLGRWGGEEFLIICPSTNLLQAEIVADKIREVIEQFTFTENLKLTCSLGVAQTHDSDNKETIFHRADKALYLAKNTGRNQVKMESFEKAHS